MPTSVLLPSLVLILTCVINVQALYGKSSPVLQVTAKTYDSLIAQSNHTSIVEFYAPWCGHCQNLKPAYEKAAKNLAGLAKVAAIDCDDDANKPFCGQMGIQGFPTLKIVRPGSKPGRPIVEDYMGPRSTKGIVEAVKDKIANHVKKLSGDALEKWLDEEEAPAKAIVFTDKGTTNPLVKSLAIDFLGSVAFAQVRDKATAQKYEVSEFPAIRLIPSHGAPPIPYEGEISRDSLVSFFSQVAPPNPDPAPKNAKSAKPSSKKSKPKSSLSASAAFSRASAAHKSSDFEEHLAGSSTIVLDDHTPTESPLPVVEAEKPMIVRESIAPIPTLSTSAEVEAACMMPRSGNCILVLLPPSQEAPSESATSALAGFAEIADKYNKRKASMIPIYAVPADNQAATLIRNDLALGPEEQMEVVATNMKRGWWRRYSSESYDVTDLENFVDAIKLGEGSRSELPAGFGVVTEKVSKPGTTETVSIAEHVESVEGGEGVADPEPEQSPEAEATGTVVSVAEAEPEPDGTPNMKHNEL
ncbi:protein disulfide-isomerase domain [Cladophialophora bantiana CBS 173.52]|uniref:protein disulfide-isomerase n=1 Tax=Cladophialophora bantiana (strain ATCC 10958 / CBS 173.52 / CDC B-1940 / NIH 8579) TaxID=1442370 RepID=A0A0D2I382_CLAB1|nr:protein disulfide-isomerase domain [Cladophialophora bantiana CBS 173.52]KIW97655.1 protein disulfide-isomerase domain [Cladophialophora bantiana CBS 173.52]